MLNLQLNIQVNLRVANLHSDRETESAWNEGKRDSRLCIDLDI